MGKCSVSVCNERMHFCKSTIAAFSLEICLAPLPPSTKIASTQMARLPFLIRTITSAEVA